MALPVPGRVYTFLNAGAIINEGTNDEAFRALNLYYANSSSLTNGQNVCLWTQDSSTEQQWRYEGGKLINMRSSSTKFVLDHLYDAATTSHENNADIWADTTTEDAHQLIDFVDSGYGNGTVRIKLRNQNLYLTAVNNANGTNAGKSSTANGNVYWTTKKSSLLQTWFFEEISAVNSGSEITITAMPVNANYTNRTEYFHPFSGLRNGTWEYNGGSEIEEKMYSLFESVFKTSPTQNNQYLYNLYGAKVTGTTKYHIGVDVWLYDGADIYAATGGEVVKYQDDFDDTDVGSNAIAIYDSENNVTWYYLHMRNRASLSEEQVIAAGTKLGKQSDAGWADGSHLHIEIYEGRYTSGPHNPPTLSGTTNALCPYPYF